MVEGIEEVEKAKKKGLLEGISTTHLLIFLGIIGLIVWNTFLKNATQQGKMFFVILIFLVLFYIFHKKSVVKPIIDAYYASRLAMADIEKRKQLYIDTDGKEGIDPSTQVKISMQMWPLFVPEGPKYHLGEVRLKLGSREKIYGAAVWLTDPLYGTVSWAEYPEGVTGREFPSVVIPESAFMKFISNPKNYGFLKTMSKLQ